MFTKLINIIIWGKCKSCGAPLTGDGFVKISLSDLSDINKKAAYDTAKSYKGLLIPDGAFIPVCSNCIDILQLIWKMKKEPKYQNQVPIKEQEGEIEVYTVEWDKILDSVDVKRTIYKLHHTFMFLGFMDFDSVQKIVITGVDAAHVYSEKLGRIFYFEAHPQHSDRLEQFKVEYL